MRLPRAALLAVATIALAPLVASAPASAAAAVPKVGQCFLITDKQTYDDYWSGAKAVSCAERHSFEVTRASALPADADAVTFAQDACDYLTVWKDVGINQPRGGVVRNPIRIEAFYFVVRGAAPPSYVCGASPVVLRGAKGAVLTSMTGRIRGMSTATRASLLYCNAAAGGREAYAPAVTVPCSRTPRWQVQRWIMWAGIYDAYPGEDVMAAAAGEMCGPGREFTYPTAATWDTGSKRTFCYTFVP